MISLLLAAAGCKTGSSTAQRQNTDNPLSEEISRVNAPVIIYKTRADYAQLVPITLSDDGLQILSYPDPKDIGEGSPSQKPKRLKNGYLLDRRGISINTAFLNMDYESYASLTTVPNLKELKELILDRDPFLELYRCGNSAQYEHLEAELNRIIETNELQQHCENLIK